MSIFAIPVVAILVTMALALARSLQGPSVFDRILAVNMFGTKTVLLIAVLGFIPTATEPAGRPDFLDLALVYALMNFIGTIAVLKYFIVQDLGAADEDEVAT